MFSTFFFNSTVINYYLSPFLKLSHLKLLKQQKKEREKERERARAREIHLLMNLLPFFPSFHIVVFNSKLLLLLIFIINNILNSIIRGSKIIIFHCQSQKKKKIVLNTGKRA